MSGGITIPGDWDDWVWSGSATAPSTNPATMAEISTTGIYGWRFIDGKGLHLPSCQLSHRYLEGSAIEAHIHWFPETTATYTLTWTLEFVDWLSVSSGSAMQSKTTLTAAVNRSVTAFQMQTESFANITGTNRKISSMANFKLSLAMTAGTACFLGGVDGHFQIDRMGSRQSTSKA